jgi:hypothetical protein
MISIGATSGSLRLSMPTSQWHVRAEGNLEGRDSIFGDIREKGGDYP